MMNHESTTHSQDSRRTLSDPKHQAISQTPTEDPRFGRVGKQTIKDTGSLTRKRMETAEEELLARSLAFMDRTHKAGKPFFLWHNTTRMHVCTRLSAKWENKSGYGLYADGMMELDHIVGELLKKLDELGIAGNTIVLFTSDNGAEVMSWRRVGMRRLFSCRHVLAHRQCLG